MRFPTASTVRLRRAGAAGCLLLAAAFPGPAAAHPHAYLEYGVTLRFDAAKRIAALDVIWLMDEMYSAYATDGLDVDRDGRIEPDELAPLARENLNTLREWGYFTYVKHDGRRIPLGPAEGGGSRMDGGRIEMRFTLPLGEPLDPRRGQVTFSSFDPTFYIDVTPLRGHPFALEGEGGRGCRVDLGPDPASTARYVPDAAVQALDIGPGDDVDRSVGARFAPWAAVTCGAAP